MNTVPNPEMQGNSTKESPDLTVRILLMGNIYQLHALCVICSWASLFMFFKLQPQYMINIQYLLHITHQITF